MVHPGAQDLYDSAVQCRGKVFGAKAGARLHENDDRDIGVALHVGEVRHVGYHGVRRIGRDAPVDAKTTFMIASMGNAFVAAGLAVLIDKGKLQWDDPVVKHLPAFKPPTPM